MITPPIDDVETTKAIDSRVHQRRHSNTDGGCERVVVKERRGSGLMSMFKRGNNSKKSGHVEKQRKPSPPSHKTAKGAPESSSSSNQIKGADRPTKQLEYDRTTDRVGAELAARALRKMERSGPSGAGGGDVAPRRSSMGAGGADLAPRRSSMGAGVADVAPRRSSIGSGDGINWRRSSFNGGIVMSMRRDSCDAEQIENARKRVLTSGSETTPVISNGYRRRNSLDSGDYRDEGRDYSDGYNDGYVDSAGHVCNDSDVDRVGCVLTAAVSAQRQRTRERSYPRRSSMPGVQELNAQSDPHQPSRSSRPHTDLRLQFREHKSSSAPSLFRARDPKSSPDCAAGSVRTAPAAMQTSKPKGAKDEIQMMPIRKSERFQAETHNRQKPLRGSRKQINKLAASQPRLGLLPQTVTKPLAPGPSSRSLPPKDGIGDNATVGTFETKESGGTISSDDADKIKGMKVPKGDVTIVFTDIQGSTSLWESNASAMKEALDTHDQIMRKCYSKHNGYEIHTEGDAFVLAFQHPVDALAFALRMQVHMYKAEWPRGILDHPDGSEVRGSFRGFRVRVGLHHGPTKTRVHEVTGRTIYEGDTVKIAKRVEAMAHGGQILTTIETWRAVSGMAEQYLGSPQVVDCGEHKLWEEKSWSAKSAGNGIVAKRVVQLVPRQLAFDYFKSRGREGAPGQDGDVSQIKTDAKVRGRQFPPINSRGKLSTCFLDAPHENGKVTIVFVFTVGMDEFPAGTEETNLALLTNLIRSDILVQDPAGYECQQDGGSWMLAFHTMAQAVTFGLNLRSALGNASFHGQVTNRQRATMVKIGIYAGPYVSMGPHAVTGRADYFGPIVNRAARVASAACPGQVCVGIPLATGEVAESPDFGCKIKTKFMGAKRLKGLTFDMALFSCYREVAVQKDIHRVQSTGRLSGGV